MNLKFCCPLDNLGLEPVPGALRCTSGHSFDIAREGYCNLLLVQQKASLNPGDNPEMVAARRRFLEGGFFLPIAEKLVVLERELGATEILDAGCGEGYYLGFLREAFPQISMAGTDISKPAIKAAAKKYKGISWAVASNKQLPFAPESIGSILSLFGFPLWDSFKNALKKDGHVLLVDPGPDHLRELRDIIYTQVKPTELVSVQPALEAGFLLIREERVDFRFSMPSASAIQDLLAMTPHGYRMDAGGRERIQRVERLDVKASVVFRVLATSPASR